MQEVDVVSRMPEEHVSLLLLQNFASNTTETQEVPLTCSSSWEQQHKHWQIKEKSPTRSTSGADKVIPFESFSLLCSPSRLHNVLVLMYVFFADIVLRTSSRFTDTLMNCSSCSWWKECDPHSRICCNECVSRINSVLSSSTGPTNNKSTRKYEQLESVFTWYNELPCNFFYSPLIQNKF